jgi:hypothetical protein
VDISPTQHARGPGGTIGHIVRMIICLCTGGFVYPNAYVEGMDPTKIQTSTEGTLYDKKKK